MNRETIKLKDKEHWLSLRTKDITSTEISALFGLSPYITPFELFHRKLQQVDVKIEESERMKWGSRLEHSIAQGIAEDQGWENVRPFKDYMRIPEFRLGSSFDEEVGDDQLLEIKNVDGIQFKRQWSEEEAPPHIELQVQHQLLVSGRKLAWIGALVGGNQVCLLQREPQPMIHQQIIERAEEFWKRIENNDAPEIDFQKDADLLLKIYGNAESGKVLQASSEVDYLARQYKETSKLETEYAKRKKEIRAEILSLIGDAEKVRGEGLSISCGMSKETVVKEFTRKASRMFRVTIKETK